MKARQKKKDGPPKKGWANPFFAKRAGTNQQPTLQTQFTNSLVTKGI